MIFDYKYKGETSVRNNADETSMSFAPDTLRQPVYFHGLLNKRVGYREAISALNAVVVSDLRFKPQDKSAYKEWAAQNEIMLLSEFGADYQKGLQDQINTIRKELEEIGSVRNQVMGPFYKARKKYFDYLYEKEKDFWFVLDPVITVHPDELFFECFSQDESTYGKLSCSYEIFKQLGEFACGTTNVDYSATLYNEFQKIREYKDTSLTVDPSGFEVATTNEDAYNEVKIDLPDTWVRGFLQVSSAMTLPSVMFELHPMDVHNICYILRRQKEKTGPRSIRFILKPGQPVELIFEPWNHKIKCLRSVYNGTTEENIRLWGRRRLLTLERLIPLTRKFSVHMLGSGLPSFFIADMGDMSFTLGLSGWTANDWSRSGNFDLMAPRMEADTYTKEKVFNALMETWAESSESLANRTGIPKKQVEGILSLYTQAGRVIYDLNKKVYRLRELSREPLPMDQLRFQSPVEEKATALVNTNKVTANAEDTAEGGIRFTGKVKSGESSYEPVLVVDKDERIIHGECRCSHYFQNKMYKGPCEHMLALRMAYNKKSWWSKFFLN